MPTKCACDFMERIKVNFQRSVKKAGKDFWSGRGTLPLCKEKKLVTYSMGGQSLPWEREHNSLLCYVVLKKPLRGTIQANLEALSFTESLKREEASRYFRVVKCIYQNLYTYIRK